MEESRVVMGEVGGAGGRHGAAMDAVKQAGLIQICQVAADSLERHFKMRSQAFDGDFAVALCNRQYLGLSKS